MSINWYPGHMAKTRRIMLEDLSQVDMVCEIVDARIPMASRNPDLQRIAGQKRHMIALNRADQADPALTARWADYYRRVGCTVIETDSQKGSFLPQFTAAARACCKDLIARNNAKGLTGKRIRIMIFGVPNVGKSSFINRLLNKKSAIAADKPGVTRKKQWFSLPGGFDFMDTPGMLWPKIENDAVGYRLAFTGTIRDEILDREDLACHFIQDMALAVPQALTARYGVNVPRGALTIPQAFELLEAMAASRGFRVSGGGVDTERMSRVLLDEFRGGQLGRISLEIPPDFQPEIPPDFQPEIPPDFQPETPPDFQQVPPAEDALQ